MLYNTTRSIPASYKQLHMLLVPRIARAWSTVSNQASVTFFSSSSKVKLCSCSLSPAVRFLVEYVEAALIKVSLPHLSAHVEGLEASAKWAGTTSVTNALGLLRAAADTIIDAIQWIVFIHTLVFANVLSACQRKH